MTGCDDTEQISEALAAFGAVLAQPIARKELEIWPDNWAAVVCVSRSMTQWHTGMAGATGLRYSAVKLVARAHGVKRRQWPQVLEDVQTIEAEILRLWREQADRKK